MLSFSKVTLSTGRSTYYSDSFLEKLLLRYPYGLAERLSEKRSARRE